MKTCLVTLTYLCLMKTCCKDAFGEEEKKKSSFFSWLRALLTSFKRIQYSKR